MRTFFERYKVGLTWVLIAAAIAGTIAGTHLLKEAGVKPIFTYRHTN